MKFDAAHVLSDHAGRCRNLHGHTYRVDVSVAGDDAAEMVVDFAELKRAIAETVLARFDHAFVYCEAFAGEREIAAVVERLGMRAVALPFRTTVENLARHFFCALAPRVPGLKAVCVWETADNRATFEKSDLT